MATATKTKTETPKSPESETPKSPEPDAPKDAPTTPDAPKVDAPTIDPTNLPPMLKDLHALVLKAEETKGQLTPVSDLQSRVDAVGALVKGMTAEAQWTLIGNLGDAYAPTTDALRALDAFSQLLGDHAESVDRTRGDQLANAWENLKSAHVEGMFSESDLPIGDALVTRWRASVPESKVSTTGTRRTKGEGETPTFSPLGFRVSYKCQQCGKTFSTRTDNLNSARNECIKHARNAHGALIGNGTSDFDSLGHALVLVGMSPTGSLSAEGRGSVSAAEGGGWKTERSDA
jgi:hypothetical protein